MRVTAIHNRITAITAGFFIYIRFFQHLTDKTASHTAKPPQTAGKIRNRSRTDGTAPRPQSRKRTAARLSNAKATNHPKKAHDFIKMLVLLLVL
ncbi:MAG: hypothetical protein Q4A84_03630 [Neisseria sp.]|uniref:hypothetical protein n=1 Tax=Neisseria sp. TaxID=192066 RepID=UPI0026DC6D82|nr:hypothetical protein [Neisseria sp.]MDO4640780.1 hypothetical protein [Neisseria sp.]